MEAQAGRGAACAGGEAAWLGGSQHAWLRHSVARSQLANKGQGPRRRAGILQELQQAAGPTVRVHRVVLFQAVHPDAALLPPEYLVLLPPDQGAQRAVDLTCCGLRLLLLLRLLLQARAHLACRAASSVARARHSRAARR